MEFGELVEPGTRAFWDDYDELDAENSQPVALSWKWMDDEVTDTDKIKPFDKLFVIEGRQVFDFVRSTILKQIQPMCLINAHNTSVFQLPDTGDYLCVIDDSVMDQAAQITDLLAPWLEQARHIYSFKFQPAYLYNTDEQFDKECFVRTVPSSADNFGLDFIAPMEDCNIVHGVSAGVSTWSHIHKRPFACYAVYMNCTQVDSFVGEKVLKLFTHLGLKCDTSYVLKIVNFELLYV